MATYEHPPTHEHPIISRRTYYLVFAALIVLTLVTIGVSFIPMAPTVHTVAGMLIAIGKATLVVMIFMHVAYNDRLTQIFALSGIVWLLILMVLMLMDYITR